MNLPTPREVAQDFFTPRFFQSKEALAELVAEDRARVRAACLEILLGKRCAGHLEPPVHLLERRCQWCDRIHEAIAAVKALDLEGQT